MSCQENNIIYKQLGRLNTEIETRSTTMPFYFTQNYWVFGLYPSSNILKTREHNISEAGSVSVLR
jgi:hypothetical protein